MLGNAHRTKTYAVGWTRAATESDLARALADLKLAARTAREAGRSVTANAIVNEARAIEVRRRRRRNTIGVVPGGAPCRSDVGHGGR